MKKIFSLLSVVLFAMAANAQVNLAEVIKSTVENDKTHDVVAVTLTQSNSYVLDATVDLGKKDVVIYGGGAKVQVKEGGQITTSAFLKVYGINFDCAEATAAPLGMSAAPDSTLKLKANYPGANQDMYYDLNEIIIDHVNFANVKNSVFTANGNNWALRWFNIENSIIQIADGAAKNVFDFKGSIKSLVVKDNTIYSVAAGGFTKSVFYLGNGSNAQPQKAWGTDATAEYVVTNNTMANLVKNFADQWPSRNNITVTAKNNIFYNVFRFQNKFVGNCKKDYTADDNLQYSTLASSTVENGLGVIGNPEIKVPTAALDLSNVDGLKYYFAPTIGAYPNGATRWSVVFHAAELAEGQQAEILKISNAITTATKGGATKKVLNDTAYPWLKYVNQSSVCDNGQYELSAGGHFASIDYRTGEPTTGKSYAYPWGDPTADYEYIAPDANPASNYGSPKVEVGYTKDAAENLVLQPKHMDIDVKNAASITLYLTGAGSKPNAADIIVKNLTTKEVNVYTTGEMANKSNKANTNTNSLKYDVTLDPANLYEVSVYPAASYSNVKVATVDEFGDVVKVDQTIPTWATDSTYVVAGLGNVPAVYLYAVKITAPEAAPICHEPGAKYAGTNYEVVKFSNYITTAKKGDADKNVLDEVNNPWMKYVNLSSVCDNGQYELSKGGHWASIDYVTGNATAGGNWKYIPEWGSETTADFEYIFPDAAPTSNLGSPKAEMGYTKQESGDLLLQPKNLSISVKNATKVELFLTGAGSNTNAADIIIKDAATGLVEKVITTDVMAGKSNKAAAANTNSQKVAIDLKASKRYTISVFPSAQYTQVEMTSVDEFGDAVKAYVPFTGNWTSANTYTAAGLSNVKAPAVFVYAAHIYGTDLTVAPVAEDALGDVTAISNVETQRVAPKKYINAKGQIVIGNYNIAGQRVK